MLCKKESVEKSNHGKCGGKLSDAEEEEDMEQCDQNL